MAFQQRFLDACRHQPVDAVPVWFMRQAGRYQPEYRQLRQKYSMLDLCRIPELTVQITKLPVTQLGVDAAILFSDIMIPVGAMGVAFDIQEHIGPVLDHAVRSAPDVEQLQVFQPEEKLPYVLASIRQLQADLTVPLIGFTGGPFTLASYLIEGGPSRTFTWTKQMMWSEPELWRKLMDKLETMIVRYLTAQIQSGAAAVQLFDSWVGSLAPSDFAAYVLPSVRRIFSALQPLAAPLIYFGVDTGELLPLIASSGATVVGVDWRVPLPVARTRIGASRVLQGNLDPALLFAPWSVIEQRAREVVDAGSTHPGFIFNLGHGVVHRQPPAEPDTLRRLTAFVHDYSRAQIAKQKVQPGRV